MSFDLGAMLKDVSNLDTSHKQIEYIQLDQIDSDPNNFYSLDGLDALADNIATVGLQQPILVRKQDNGRYMIVSGHRRRAAVEILAKNDPEHWTEIQCIVEQDAVSPALQQLRLIYANANTRSMTSAELGEQAAQVEKLLYQLKNEGYDFPGRMRDHVAEAVNASKTKLARLKVIRENLADGWMPAYKNNIIVESTAYELAHMPKEWQKLILDEKINANVSLRSVYADDVKKIMERFQQIEKIKCKKSGNVSCHNKDKMRRKAVCIQRYFDCPCTNCCDSCDKLASCKNACPLLADKIKQIKADKKEALQQEKLETQKKEQPVIDYIRGVYDRVGKARQACGASVEDLYNARKAYYVQSDCQKQSDLESGAAKIDINTTLPFGYCFRYDDAKRLCAVADLLGCSIDYLLGRDVTKSNTAQPPENVPNLDTWRTGTPESEGNYIVMVRYCDESAPGPAEMYWDGKQWLAYCIPIDDDCRVITWIPEPRELLGDVDANDFCSYGERKDGDGNG